MASSICPSQAGEQPASWASCTRVIPSARRRARRLAFAATLVVLVVMASHDRGGSGTGQTAATTAPTDHWTPDLAIITGVLDPVWQTLRLGHPTYKRFRWALMWQEHWDYGEHLTYWQTHLDDWPLKPVKPSSTGLKARHVALWQRAGYSQVQIEEALCYGRGNAPKALWRRARDYSDWLRESAPKVRPETGSKPWPSWRRCSPAELRSRPGGRSRNRMCSAPRRMIQDEARRYVRRRWRTPRVVTVSEWERGSFGWPEPISEALLYGEVDLQLIQRAQQRLLEQVPYHAVNRAV